jgi:hypothetical protein
MSGTELGVNMNMPRQLKGGLGIAREIGLVN